MQQLGNVLIRADLNVPIEDGKVLDNFRIERSSRVVSLIRDRSKTITFISHLGRPEEKTLKNSLSQIVVDLEEHLAEKVTFIDEIYGEKVSEAINEANRFKIFLLENIRFDKGEVSNDMYFSKNIASPFDTYIFDAFGASHREHSSVVSIGEHLKSFQGPLVDEEISELNQLKNPTVNPYMIILGGSKVSDKISLINNFLPKVDKMLIGGAMCFTFLKSMGHNIGRSLYQEEMLEECEKIINGEYFNKVLLPIDIGVTNNLVGSKRKDVSIESISDADIGIDIGPDTVNFFLKELTRAKLIFWNGPMGVFENSSFNFGTMALSKALTEYKGYTVVGGGDSVNAIKLFSDVSLYDFVSTGGGASLEFLQGNNLPGLGRYPSLEDSL